MSCKNITNRGVLKVIRKTCRPENNRPPFHAKSLVNEPVMYRYSLSLGGNNIPKDPLTGKSARLFQYIFPASLVRDES